MRAGCVEVGLGPLGCRAAPASLALRDEGVPLFEQRRDDRVRFSTVADTSRGEEALDLFVVDGGFGVKLLLERVGAARQSIQPIDELIASGQSGLAARDARRVGSDRPRRPPRAGERARRRSSGSARLRVARRRSESAPGSSRMRPPISADPVTAGPSGAPRRPRHSTTTSEASRPKPVTTVRRGCSTSTGTAGCRPRTSRRRRRSSSGIAAIISSEIGRRTASLEDNGKALGMLFSRLPAVQCTPTAADALGLGFEMDVRPAAVRGRDRPRSRSANPSPPPDRRS